MPLLRKQDSVKMLWDIKLIPYVSSQYNYYNIFKLLVYIEKSLFVNTCIIEKIRGKN